MCGFPYPKERLTFTDVDQAVTPFTFLPTLVCDDLTRELAQLIALKQVLYLKHEADLLARLLIREVMCHFIRMLESDTNRQHLLLREYLATGGTLCAAVRVLAKSCALTDCPLLDSLLGFENLARQSRYVLFLLEKLDAEESDEANFALLTHEPSNHKIDLLILSVAFRFAPLLARRVF